MLIEIANAANVWWWLDATKAYAIDDIIRVAIALVILFSWILSVFFIIWWWVMLILSGWKEEKTKPAINSIRHAVIWIIVIIGAVFLAPKLWSIAWLNVESYLSPTDDPRTWKIWIFHTIKDLWDKFFWKKDSINISPNSTKDELPADFSDL